MDDRTKSPDAPLFQVNIQAQDGHFIILLGGELDVTALEDLRLVVAQMDRPSHQAAVVDLTDLTFCDMSGLRALQALKQLLSNRHPSVTFKGVSSRIQPILGIAKVHHLLDLEETDPQ